MHKNLTAHSCVSLFFFFFAALWCYRPLGMINPEELNIEREEEIDGREGWEDKWEIEIDRQIDKERGRERE